MSKDHEAGILAWGFTGLFCDRAVLREKGRVTPRLLGPGRLLVMVDRRPDGLHDFGGGVRPAGLRMGADLGVDGAIFWGVIRRGETLTSRVVRAMREVLKGFGEPLATSSSSKARLRLAERFRVEGLMFSESSSAKMEGLVARAPGLNVRMGILYPRNRDGPFWRFWRFKLDRNTLCILGESRLAKGWRVGVMVRAAMVKEEFKVRGAAWFVLAPSGDGLTVNTDPRSQDREFDEKTRKVIKTEYRRVESRKEGPGWMGCNYTGMIQSETLMARYRRNWWSKE